MSGIGFPGHSGGRKSYKKVYYATILRGDLKGKTLVIKGVDEAGGVKKFAGFLEDGNVALDMAKQINTLRHRLKFGKLTLSPAIPAEAPAQPVALASVEGNAVTA